jgi:hypothetical protein
MAAMHLPATLGATAVVAAAVLVLEQLLVDRRHRQGKATMVVLVILPV